MINDPNWTDVVQAICAIISVIGVIGTLCFAAWQIQLASKQLRESSIQSERESIDRNRPYIAVDVVPSVGGPEGVWDLRITNTGGTAARRITIRLQDDTFISSEDSTYLRDHLERFSDTSFDLMPRAIKRVYWIVYSQSRRQVTDGAPLSGTVLVDYYWERDGGSEPVHYQDHLPYDCETAPIPAPATGSTRMGNTPEAQLKNIEYAIRAISRHIGQLGR